MSTMSPMAREVAAGLPTEADWVARFADEVIAEAERARPASRSSARPGSARPGPIHLGNLREVMTPHLVADEIRRRGHDVRAPDLLGRLRPVPQGARPGVDPSWAEHIGKPLTVGARPGRAARTRTGPSTSRRR